MGRVLRRTEGALRTNYAIKKQIVEKFGEEAVEKAKRRLCARCQRSPCLLSPICSDGSDCPYFKPKEE